MTQFVADNTPIPQKVWRRHSDPPALWLGVATISVILHLLLFWLLRSHSSSLLLQQSSSNPVPVEFVEISPRRRTPSKAPSKAKSAAVAPRKSVTPSQKPAIQENLTSNTSTVEDGNAIAFTNTKKASTSQPRQQDVNKSSSQTKTFEQKAQQEPPQPIAKPTRQPQPTPTTLPLEQQQPPPPTDNENLEPTPSPNATDTTEDTQNQANQELDEQNQALDPQNNSTIEPTPSDSSETKPEPFSDPETPGIPKQPDGDVTVGKGTPLEDIAPSVKPEEPQPLDQPSQGVALASWEIEADAVKKDLQDNPPQIVGDIREKELNFLALNRELDEPIDFKAVLLIDSNGNLNSIFLDPEPKIPEPQATQYQEYAEEIFKGQKFIPASSNNGNKPPLGQMVVRIRIQRSPKS